jgi:AraC family transcriptional regulator of adaptative response / DNA-3-methyladenine glycosylase II
LPPNRAAEKLHRRIPDDSGKRVCYRGAMQMKHATLYSRVLAGDAAYNGRFFTGVLTTGIYCLPSCKARKPKPENVRFFPTCEAARAAGLRPCRKCHPDDFARGADPVLEDMETLVREIRADPARFADVSAIVRRSGFGATRLFELFRQHFQATPADLLLRARVATAKQKLVATAPQRPRDGGRPPAAERSLVEIAHEVGFESLSVFHEHFRRLNGITPAAYRDLRSSRTFRVLLPAGYPLGDLRRALTRDPHSLTERLDGHRAWLAIQLNEGPALLRLELSDDTVDTEIVTAPLESKTAAIAAHAVIVGLLGLDQDAAAFTRMARKLGLARLVAGRPELRLVQTTSIFESVLWSIIGQQINFPFACLLRRRLIEHTCTPLDGAEGLYCPPTAAAIAALDPDALLPLQFSRQKARTVVSVARLIADGQLDLAALRGASATRVERTLLAIRGLGPWSVNYIMMRSLGFADCVPLGDTGVSSGLVALLKLEERPDVDATRKLMAMFSPYRSLATAHLWQFQKPVPV